MKILYIKAGKIHEKSGGGLESYKILYALEKWITNNPEDELKIISEDKLDVEELDPPVKKKWKDYGARFFLHSSYLYIDYKFGKLKKYILSNKYDIIILGSSRLGFIAKDVKKTYPNTKIIVHYDNIEFDYVEAYFLEEKGAKNLFYKLIERISVKRDEKNSVKYGDLNLLLTHRDKERLNYIYSIENINSRIIPICLNENSKIFKLKNKNSLNLFFIGSLWYKSNAVGITWFLDNIWMKIKEVFPCATLTIGGSRPTEELSKKVKTYKSIRFFPNFEKIENILYQNSIMISPILEGAGMKVKIAESLSIGFPVIASKESLVGYEEAYEESLSEGVIYKAENANEYLESIENILSKDYSHLSNNAKKLFYKYYSLERAVESFEEILLEYKKEKE